jgi:hypothetical protein
MLLPFWQAQSDELFRYIKFIRTVKHLLILTRLSLVQYLIYIQWIADVTKLWLVSRIRPFWKISLAWGEEN